MCKIKINSLDVNEDNIQTMITYSIMSQKKSFVNNDIIDSVNELMSGKYIPDRILNNKFKISDMVKATIAVLLDAGVLSQRNNMYNLKAMH